MENKDIRQKIQDAGLRHWQVARAIGCGEATLVRWLREELTADRREKIVAAIEKLSGKGA